MEWSVFSHKQSLVQNAVHHSSGVSQSQRGSDFLCPPPDEEGAGRQRLHRPGGGGQRPHRELRPEDVPLRRHRGPAGPLPQVPPASSSVSSSPSSSPSSFPVLSFLISSPVFPPILPHLLPPFLPHVLFCSCFLSSLLLPLFPPLVSSPFFCFLSSPAFVSSPLSFYFLLLSLSSLPPRVSSLLVSSPLPSSLFVVSCPLVSSPLCKVPVMMSSGVK